ncbi:hypothetical protein [Phormidesmis sp. 146-12]
MNIMSEIILNINQLKELIKIAIVELLQEQKETFADIVVEAMEDMIEQQSSRF